MRCFPNGCRLLVLLLLYPVFLFGQQITILDRESGMPLGDVAVFNRDRTKTAISEADGTCDLSAFSSRERISFRHIGYQTLIETKNAILRSGGRLYMEIKPEELPEVVMSVSRWEQQKREVPQKVESIDASSIALANPQTAADVLMQSGKVFVQKSQFGGGSPMIRGFATNRVLLSVDGVRMNNAIFRGGNLQNVISIDPYTLSNTEVLFGPGSVIYGSDAIGGVMNFYTRSPRLIAEDSLRVSGTAAYRTATASWEQTLHGKLELSRQKWASLSSLTFNSFGDLRMGSHGPEEYLRPFYVVPGREADQLVPNPNPRRQLPSGYSQWNAMQKLIYRPGRQWEYKLGLHWSETSDFDRYDRLIRPGTEPGTLRSAEWYYGPQQWFMSNFQAKHTGRGKLYEGLKIGLAYQRFGESRNERNFNEDTLFRTEENVDALSFNLDLETRKNGPWQVFYGLEYLFNGVGSEGSAINRSDGSVQPAASRYPDGSTWQSAAGYLNLIYKPDPALSFLAGARYNHTWISATFDQEFYDFPFQDANLDNGALTGSVGMSWFPARNTQITLNGSTAFRAPNIDDIGKIFDSEPGSVVVPNPELEAEYAYNAEVGLRQNFGDKLILKGAAYYTYLVDALVRRDFELNGQRTIFYNGVLSNVQAIQNAARAYIYGFEFGFDAIMNESLGMSGNLTLSEGVEEDDSGAEYAARHVAPTFADLSLNYNAYPLKAALVLNYNGEIPFDDLALSERNKAFIYATDAQGNPYSPSWYTINLRSAYTFRQRYHLSLVLENITDQRYRTYSSGIAAPGFNLIAGLRVEL
ncbi:TonB-dependent receptor [Robiginitalea myxolifaciens]|nr:TonB-dependent receptor [Robiginitalea myxolifaciens]